MTAPLTDEQFEAIARSAEVEGVISFHDLRCFVADARHHRAALAEAQAEIGRLREVLAPFATLADEIERCAASYESPWSDPKGWSKSCTWEQLLAARAALAPKGKDAP